MSPRLGPAKIAAMPGVDKDLRFTERQRDVVRLIATGCSNLEIAERLGVSPRTAKAHADVLRTKLRVSRRRQIPAAYRKATGDDPLQSLEAAHGVRDDSRRSR
jgi:DNA-binding NarL/FixJ family response regulator